MFTLLIRVAGGAMGLAAFVILSLAAFGAAASAFEE
jgi:hypothetical protein